MKQLNFDGQTYVEEAVAFIQEHEPPEGYFGAFSGGKDSVGIKALVKMAGVRVKWYYHATGIDPPELTKFIRRHHPDVTWTRPKETFFAGIVRHGYPSRKCRWCCQVLKEDAFRHIPMNVRILGIRAEESPKRAKRGRISLVRKQKLVKPIFRWKEWQLWDFIEANRLPYCRLYDEGFGRIGCVVCPFICRESQRQLELHRNRWPLIYRRFESAMKDLWGKKHKEKLSFGDFMDHWYHGRFSMKHTETNPNQLRLCG